MTKPARTFTVDLGWEILLRDLGVAPRDVLRAARLPEDLFAGGAPSLDRDGYFRLWQALQDVTGDPQMPLKLGQTLSVDAFSPPLFAAFCSPDLTTALTRLAQYKPLIGPLSLHLAHGADGVTARFDGIDGLPLPASLAAMELVFLTQLARSALRDRVVPVAVTLVQPPDDPAPFAAYFGVAVAPGPTNSVTFDPTTAFRPFLSANAAMFEVFDPALRGRLADLGPAPEMREKLRACLMEMLPAGDVSMAGAARRLAMSQRTLQRRLKDEGTSFQAELNTLRADLATHYLTRSRVSPGEISFLLGYDDPNSFFRAFQGWTGTTPARVRAGGRPA